MGHPGSDFSFLSVVSKVFELSLQKNPHSLNNYIRNIMNQYLGTEIDSPPPLPSSSINHDTCSEDNDTRSEQQMSDKDDAIGIVCERLSNEEFPQQISQPDQPKAPEFTEITESVNNNLSKAAPGITKKVIGINPEVVSASDFILITIRLPEGLSENEFDITAASSTNHVSIKWKTGYMEQIVPLPNDALIAMAAASMHGNILEIRIPRNQSINHRQISIQNI